MKWKHGCLRYLHLALSKFNETNTSVDPTSGEMFTSVEELRETIHSSNAKKSFSNDRISNFLLRKLPNLALLLLTIIFNNCLNNCYFPNAWKLAKVVPVQKKVNRTLVEGYRPIALLCCVSKVFESIMLRRINAYSEERGILPSY